MDRTTELILNSKLKDHGNLISDLLLEADTFICMVAFAKTSSFKFFKSNLKIRLKNGLRAKFAIGLDFYLTEPSFLFELFKFSKIGNLELFLSNDQYVFHPKIYSFSNQNTTTTLIGSANLTGGGLQSNHEASFLLVEQDKSSINSITTYFDDLIRQEVLIPATKTLIDSYELAFKMNESHQNLIKRKKKLAQDMPLIDNGNKDLNFLREFLLCMKLDRSNEGFDAHKELRSRNIKSATDQIESIVSIKNIAETDFLSKYEILISFFHSGGLHRGKIKSLQESNEISSRAKIYL